MLAPVLAPTSFDQTYTSYLRFAAVGLSDPAAGRVDPDADQRVEPAHRPHHLHPGTATHPGHQRQGDGVAAAGWWRCRRSAGWSPPPVSAWRRPRAATLDANLNVGVLVGYLLFVLLNVATGVALGALLHNSAAAIVLYFALPIAFALLGRASTSLGQWVDSGTTFNWVLNGEWSGHTPQILATVILWVALPVAAGLVRTVRREIN